MYISSVLFYLWNVVPFVWHVILSPHVGGQTDRQHHIYTTNYCCSSEVYEIITFLEIIFNKLLVKGMNDSIDNRL